MVVERLDYLPGNKRFIYQSKDIFSFSMDAVLLAKFATIGKQTGKMIDLCAGNGAVPLLLSLRTQATCDAVEIQEVLYKMLKKSVEYNNLEEQIRPIHQDILKLAKEVEWGSYDLVTCNPPYFPVTKDHYYHMNEQHNYARHEIACTLEDVIRVSAKLLNFQGRLAMVHRPERVVEIISYMTQYDIEPKRMQFVHPKRNKDANMVLVEGTYRGKKEMKTLPPIVVYGEDNQYLKEFKEYYER